MKKLMWLLLILALFSTSSCIFGKSVTKVMSYRNGNIFLSNRSHFTIGELPATWKKMKVPAYAIAFHNEGLGATIATDAFCGPAYEDLPLTLMTSQLMAGVSDYEIQEQKEFMLDGRGALRTVAEGSVDGVPLMFDIVVIKKNRCNIDFMCITPASGFAEAAADFELFYSGFHYE